MCRLLSALVYWSPIFEDVDFIPYLVFPFVKVFENDTFMAFEIVLTVIGNSKVVTFLSCYVTYRIKSTGVRNGGSITQIHLLNA
jgi:hypothetical protein